MKIVNKIFTLFLVAIVALGSVGVSVSQHFCHNEQETISFFDFSSNCSADELHEHVEEVDACCQSTEISCEFDEQCKEDCCTVDSKFFKVNFDYLERVPNHIVAIVNSNPIFDFSKNNIVKSCQVAFPLPRPPDDFREVYLEDIQSYLI